MWAEIAAWGAPAATMLAAMMTAANLGARLTGWGFVVFTIGSVGWIIVGLTERQTGLIVANGLLLLVNGVGVWRWLGRNARYEAAGEAVAAHPAPVLPASSLTGRVVTDAGGAEAGKVVDVIIDCRSAAIAAVMLRTGGGVGGVGERLVTLPMADLALCEDALSTRLTAARIAALPGLD